MTNEELMQVYIEYKTKEIIIGFISYKDMDWVSEKLGLPNLSDEELSILWDTVWDFFTSMERKEEDIDKAFFMQDTRSAWLEVINHEARKRRGEA